MNSKNTFKGNVTQILDNGYIAVIPEEYMSIHLSSNLTCLKFLRTILQKVFANSPDAVINEKYHKITEKSILLGHFCQGYVGRVKIIEVHQNAVKVLDIDNGKISILAKSRLKFLPEELNQITIFPLAIMLKIECSKIISKVHFYSFIGHPKRARAQLYSESKSTL